MVETVSTNDSQMELYTVPLQINGKEVKTPTTFDVVSPTTRQVVWKSASASKQDAIAAAESAQVAFLTWAATKPANRKDIFLIAAQSSSNGLKNAQSTSRLKPQLLNNGLTALLRHRLKSSRTLQVELLPFPQVPLLVLLTTLVPLYSKSHMG